jgi:hypothetical protein
VTIRAAQALSQPLSTSSLTDETLALRLADAIVRPRRWSAADRHALTVEAAHRLWGESHSTDLLGAWADHFGGDGS